MNHLLALLERPQFAFLKTLVPPDRVRLRKKALKKIAESCPLLEDIDIGYSIYSSMRADDNTLMEIPALFPHLKKIRFYLTPGKVTRNGLWRFLETMADRLVDLRVFALVHHNTAGAWALSDADLQEISRHCQNLEHFRYEQEYYNGGGEVLSKDGVIALVRGCPKLKSIYLANTHNVPKIEAFEYIAEHAANLKNLLVVGDDRLMNNSDLCHRLGEKIENFEAISTQENYDRRLADRRANSNWY
jgi:hypothetical protein